MPDEEIGGHDGMEKLIEMDFFKNLNIGFALDEGLANPTEEYMLYYSERLPWWIEITVFGAPGHGSQFLHETVGEKLRGVINGRVFYFSPIFFCLKRNFVEKTKF